MADHILERSVIHKGKVFIKAGEESIRAYVVQSGKVCSFFVNDDGEEIEVERHGPGIIIGEMALIRDEIPNVSYKALADSTVVTITRQDFEKKMVRIDGTVKKIFQYLAQKLDYMESETLKEMKLASELDDKAIRIVESMTQNMDIDKQKIYEKKLLRPINTLIKALADVQTSERRARQKEDLDKKLEAQSDT